MTAALATTAACNLMPMPGLGEMTGTPIAMAGRSGRQIYPGRFAATVCGPLRRRRAPSTPA